MASSVQGVRYIALARLSDGLALASYKPSSCANIAGECEATVTKVLSSGNIKPTTQLTVVVNDRMGTMHLSARTDDVIAVVTSATYPRRAAFDLLKDLHEKTSQHVPTEAVAACTKHEELSRTCHAWLKEICKKYNDLGSVDKITSVSIQVDEVKTVMEGNINRILDNAEALNSVEDKAEGLRNNAMQFQRQSEDLRRILWWRNFKMKCIVGLLVACIVGYIVIPILINVYQASNM
mmetsp:Transcript_37859/g.72546  ORF Transcript_37859/g.72546 Transcript_37859/m.72546 type:complete len:236 (+) Transcript_37859:276-983(+)